jgi:hypothetical protein
MLVLHGHPTLKDGISGQQCSLFVVEWRVINCLILYVSASHCFGC